MATPVDLVIRFNTPEISDLTINIPSAQSTTPLGVKQRIRKQLASSVASNRLRLISSGRFLPDTTALSKCISIPPAPPRTASTASDAPYKGKGKAPALAQTPAPPIPKLIINCSIGDVLGPSDLAQEAADALTADAALTSSTNAPTASSATTPTTSHAAAAAAAAAAPRGFDRLLTAGFSAPDIADLRANHRAVLANSHTPDTLPTGSALLALEDRWLDNAGDTATTTGGASADDEAAGLDDMLVGNLVGFFWPVALLMFAQEANLWSRRRWIAVLSGVLVNLTFGFLRVTS